jgi:hypothetical protein
MSCAWYAGESAADNNRARKFVDAVLRIVLAVINFTGP